MAGGAGALAYAMLAWLPTLQAVLIGGYVLLSAAVSLGYAGMPALLSEHVPRADIGVANGLNSLTRWLGGAVFTAVAAAILGQAASPSEGQMRAIFLGGLAAAVGILASAALGLRRMPHTAPGRPHPVVLQWSEVPARPD